MKLKHQLLAGFGGMFLLVLTLGVLALWSVSALQHRTDEMATTARKVQLSLVIPGILNLNRERALTTLFLDDPEQIRALDAERARTVALNDEYLKELDASVVKPEGRELLKTMAEKRRTYLDALAVFVRQSKGADRQTLMGTVERELGDKVRAYQAAYDAMSVHQDGNLKESQRNADDTARNARTAAIVTLVLAVLVSAGLVTWIVRSVLNTLGGEPAEAAGSVALIARGDLTQPIANTRPGSLLGNLESMRVELNSTISRLKHGATRLVEFSTTLAQTSRAVADGAGNGSNAAANIAAAIEEMTASITDLSHNAANAAQTTRGSGESAARGSKTVLGLTEGMARLSDSVKESADKVADLGRQSDEIRSIVGLIQSIADQTNLLALNAAIEAARAGEEGRGFAVVADEVRQLAQRTTVSTQDIASKIQGIQGNVKAVVAIMDRNVQQVTEGEQLAEKLEAAGVDVRRKTFNGSTHEFFGMGLVVPDAAAAQTFAAHELKRAFGTAILPI